VTGIRRDKPTVLGFAQLSLFAWVVYGLGASLALLRDDQGTTRALSGLHGTSLAVAGIAAALGAPALMRRWGRGRVMRWCTIAVTVAIVGLLIPQAPYPMTMAAVASIGFFGTALMISVNAFLYEHQGAAAPAALTEGNAIASVAGLIAPLTIGLFATTVLGWRMGVLIAAIGMAAVEIIRGSTRPYGVAPRASSDDGTSSLPAPRLSRSFYLSMILIVCFIGAEYSLVFWGPDLLRDRAGFGPAAAAASLAAVTSGMAIGRAFGARLALRFRPIVLLRSALVIALAGFILSWTVPSGTVIISGLFVTGLGLSVLWPLGLARAIEAADGRANVAASRASLFVNIAIALAPFALGVLADLSDIHLALLLVPAFLVTALLILAGTRGTATTTRAGDARDVESGAAGLR